MKLNLHRWFHFILEKKIELLVLYVYVKIHLKPDMKRNQVQPNLYLT
jgi:hypothetical protein